MQIQPEIQDGNIIIKIPTEFAERLGLGDGDVLDISVRGDMMILKSADSSSSDLDSLLAGVTEENMHTAESVRKKRHYWG